MASATCLRRAASSSRRFASSKMGAGGVTRTTVAGGASLPARAELNWKKETKPTAARARKQTTRVLILLFISTPGLKIWKGVWHGSINHGGHREKLSHKKAQEAQKVYQQRPWVLFYCLCLLCIFVADSFCPSLCP